METSPNITTPNFPNIIVDMTLHILDETALFTSHVQRKTDTVTIYTQDKRRVVLRVRGCEYRFDGGVITIPLKNLSCGANVCEVYAGNTLMPCEGLIVRGGYILPAGITDKAYVLNLYKTCVTLSERNAELEREVAELTKKAEAFTDDIFDLG
jgi:hypothetical protein